MSTIVVCDDEPDVLESTVMVLSLEGHDVHGCSRVDQLLPLLRNVRPNLLLQDVYMPGLNIDHLVPKLRDESSLRAMKILVFTASADGEEICRRTHADGFIRKPFEAAKVNAQLRRYVLQAPPPTGAPA